MPFAALGGGIVEYVQGVGPAMSRRKGGREFIQSWRPVENND